MRLYNEELRKKRIGCDEASALRQWRRYGLSSTMSERKAGGGDVRLVKHPEASPRALDEE